MQRKKNAAWFLSKMGIAGIFVLCMALYSGSVHAAKKTVNEFYDSEAFGKQPIDWVDNLIVADDLGVQYIYRAEDNTLAVNGYDMREASLVIPDSYQDIPVTEVADYAFQGSDLTSVTFGANIRKIGENSFYLCNSLKEVHFSSSLQQIGKYAFSCTAIRQIVLPDAVEQIGESCFEGCGELTSVTLGKQLKQIPKFCFANAAVLKKLEVPSAVTEIKSSAFSGCVKLYQIVIPDSVTDIATDAFYYCKCNLLTIVAPKKF